MRPTRASSTAVLVVAALAVTAWATRGPIDGLFDGPSLGIAASIAIGLILAASLIVLGPGRTRT